MKLISWNVAGFRACLKKGFEEFFYNEDADVYCLQEVKATEDQFFFKPDGYEMYLYPAEKKGYSGTAVFTRVKPLKVTYGMGIEEHDHEGRVITVEFKDFYLVNEYVPNAKQDLSRLGYRMVWEDVLRKYKNTVERFLSSENSRNIISKEAIYNINKISKRHIENNNSIEKRRLLVHNTYTILEPYISKDYIPDIGDEKAFQEYKELREKIDSFNYAKKNETNSQIFKTYIKSIISYFKYLLIFKIFIKSKI